MDAVIVKGRSGDGSLSGMGEAGGEASDCKAGEGCALAGFGEGDAMLATCPVGVSVFDTGFYQFVCLDER